MPQLAHSPVGVWWGVTGATVLLLVVPLLMKSHLFSLPPCPDLNNQPMDTAGGHVHCNVVPGSPIRQSSDGHEKGEGQATVDGSQEALYSTRGP